MSQERKVVAVAVVVAEAEKQLSLAASQTTAEQVGSLELDGEPNGRLYPSFG